MKLRLLSIFSHLFSGGAGALTWLACTQAHDRVLLGWSAVFVALLAWVLAEERAELGKYSAERREQMLRGLRAENAELSFRVDRLTQSLHRARQMNKSLMH